MSVTLHHAAQLSPQINLTDAATRHILSYLEQNPGHAGVRLSVKKTGCSGWSYVVDYVLTAAAEDLKMPLSDGYWLCVDKQSYPKLKNMRIDYVRQGLNYKLVFDNPNQKGACGCGESFTVE